MATLTKQQLAIEIKAHIDKEGGPYNTWYVGITGDPKTRLFTEHRVREKGDWYIWRWAQTAQEAREVESYFVNTLKTDGAGGGGDDESSCVYAYKKTRNTTP